MDYDAMLYSNYHQATRDHHEVKRLGSENEALTLRLSQLSIGDDLLHGHASRGRSRSRCRSRGEREV